MVCSFLPDCYQKYVTANSTFSSDFKLYDPNIPKYLHNRPHYFVKQRFHAAKLSYSHADVKKVTTTSFSVRSADRSGWYKVQLGNSVLFPKCECADFDRHYLPCKHFFAVFQFIPSSWDLLPDYFVNCPLLTIDPLSLPAEEAASTSIACCSKDNIETTVPLCKVHPSTSVSQDDLSVNGMSVMLRSNLQLMVDFSYTCKNPHSLRDINAKIQEIVQHTKAILPTESGLTISSPISVKRKKLCTPASAKKIRPLPMPKRKTKLTLFQRYKNRSGRFADKVKAGADTETINFRLASSISLTAGAHLRLRHQRALKRARLCLNKKRKATKCSVKKRKIQQCIPNVGVQVTGHTRVPVDPYKKRILTQADMTTILGTHWLSDQIINFTQNVLRSVTQVQGLYDTSLGPHLAYPRADRFYQLLHDRNHWVLISTVECQPSHVKLFDSLYDGRISKYLQKQTAAIMRTSTPEVIFSVQNVQQQPNSNDCGVFSIAFLVELLFGGDPTAVLFDVSKLRPHLHESLKKQQFTTSFPKSPFPRVHTLLKAPIHIPVYCVCRMPYFEEEAVHMAECDRCHNWYHRKCIVIPKSVFLRKNKFWICPNC